MKIETRKIEKEVKVYVSDDGAEFDAACDCAFYERSKRARTAQTLIDKLPQFCHTPSFGDNGDFSWVFFRVSSEDDVENVKAALFCSDSFAIETHIDVSTPGWIVAVVDDDGYGWLYTWTDLMDEFCSFMNKAIDKMQEESER